jgi:hypothetical protein
MQQGLIFRLRLMIHFFNSSPSTKTMVKFLLIFALLTGVAMTDWAAPSEYPSASRESIEWCDVWISHANETNLPRVLLIGDSISRDYYPGVERLLSGKAYVGRLSSSAFIGDPVLPQQIKATLASARFDVILFNNGMHGWQHGENEYRQAFPEFLETIHRCAPHAKLIWASTTPLKNSPAALAEHSTEATDERIAARNSIALRFVEAKGIPVADLYSLMSGHPEFHSDNVHFGQQGIALQAAQVAAQIEPLLPRR